MAVTVPMARKAYQVDLVSTEEGANQDLSVLKVFKANPAKAAAILWVRKAMQAYQE